MPDEDNYPSDEDVDAIKSWEYKTSSWKADLMAFVKKLWWMPDWGWSESVGTGVMDEPVWQYSISTGGWSGNEILISALQSNYVFWSLCWVQSRRGGHYIFEIPLKEAHGQTSRPTPG